MTRIEVLQKLQTIRAKGAQALRLLEAKPLPPASLEEARRLMQELKEDLQVEYQRMLPERVQRTMTMFELSVYSPTIEEIWKKSGISRLKLDAIPNQKWEPTLEAIVYTADKYIS